jgi:hypothetical protein
MKLEIAKAGYWPEAVGTYGFTLFSNGEGLIEAAGPKRVLHLGKTVELYYGVKDTAEADCLMYLFKDELDRVTGVVLILMTVGFPEGKQALTFHEYTSRTVEMEGKTFKVSAKRAGDNEIAFRMVGPGWHVEGLWSTKKSDPWPDSTPLNGWTTDDGHPVANLGEARRLAERAPRGLASRLSCRSGAGQQR